MIFLALSPGGNYAFYDSELGPVPDEKVALDKDLYQKLLAASTRGATLALQNGTAIALDHQGQPVNLEAMEADSFYGPPPTLSQQAIPLLQTARQQFQDLQMAGQTFGPKMQAYIQALNAIIKGSDTASTTLPSAPSDPTE